MHPGINLIPQSTNMFELPKLELIGQKVLNYILTTTGKCVQQTKNFRSCIPLLWTDQSDRRFTRYFLFSARQDNLTEESEDT